MILADVLSKGTKQEKETFLAAIKDQELEQLFSTTIDQLLNQYKLIEMKTEQLDRGLLPMLKKNENYLLKEINFLKLKLEDTVKLRHDVILNKYARVDLALRPDGFPQERIWNIFYYLNHYGLNFIDEIMTGSYEFDGRHKVLKL
jgi:uncharacterized protein YllA (UPF0747 family)